MTPPKGQLKQGWKCSECGYSDESKTRMSKWAQSYNQICRTSPTSKSGCPWSTWVRD